MTTLTITEALYTIAAAAPHIDETNIVAAVRNAQLAVLAHTGESPESLHILRDGDEVDGLITIVWENGARNIFGI